MKKPLTKKKPRDYSTFSVEQYNDGAFFIGGIDAHTFISEEDDAKMIVDALTFYQKYRKVLRQLERVQGEIELLSEYSIKN